MPVDAVLFPRRFQYNEANVMHFSFNLLRIKGCGMVAETSTVPQPPDMHAIYQMLFVQLLLRMSK
jgi:hypothetical protein